MLSQHAQGTWVVLTVLLCQEPVVNINHVDIGFFLNVIETIRVHNDPV